MDSRNRSAVGLMVIPGTECSFLPLNLPLIILNPMPF